MKNNITYTLTHAEQQSLLELYSKVASTTIQDTNQHETINKCETVTSDLMHRLPNLWHSIQTQLIKPEAQGIIHVRNLPMVTHAKILSVIISHLLGKIIRYEGEGDYIIDIKAQPSGEVARPSFKNSRVFGVHTDLSYVAAPPPFFILHSINNDTTLGGLTTWCSLHNFLALLSAKTIDQLSKPQFIFPAPSHYRGVSSVIFSIIMQENNSQYIRFRRDGIRAKTYEGMLAVAELIRAIDGQVRELYLETNSAVLIDNRKCLHGRTAFLNTMKPRLLHRIYVSPSA